VSLSLREGEIIEPTGDSIHTARPRTIRDAKALGAQEEEKKRVTLSSKRLEMSLGDTNAALFGIYDRYLVDSVKSRWQALLDERNFAAGGRGKVVLSLVLHPDGRVTDLSTLDQSASEVQGYICQKSVLDSAPFQPWPSEMRRVVGGNRPIRFTFYYNYPLPDASSERAPISEKPNQRPPR
jgi:hypothetical protein